MRKVGLIGGLALRAGIFYYEQIQKRVQTGHLSLELMLNHADVSRVLSYVSAGDRVGLGNYLGSLANELADGGCQIIAVTAVAPHLAVSELAHVSRAHIANVLHSIPSGLTVAGIERVAVFGNRSTMQTNVFGAVPERMAVSLNPDDLDVIHNMYMDIALHGKRATPPEMQELDRLAQKTIQENKAEAILLAGTDLSSFYAEQKPDFRFIDVAQIHIDQILRLASAA